MHKIKERVSFDRYLVKLSKRLFVLTDLVFDSTLFAQVFTNEQMKFCFKADQTLTTFAYEISRSHKEKVKRSHFVHIAKTDVEGRITYHSFPVLINYQDTEPLKNIALKIFKGLRGLVTKSLFKQDKVFAGLGENESFAYAFGGLPQGDPYEMVLVLKDGSRWKLDHHQNKRLSMVVDPEQIDRFEAIFNQASQFQEHQEAFKSALNATSSPQAKDQPVKEDVL